MVLVATGGVVRRWRQVQGARWVPRLLGVQVALLCVGAGSGILTGAVFVGALPIVLAQVLVGAVLGGSMIAFDRQRRWSWWVLLAFQLVALPADVALGRWAAVVVGVVSLAMLVHPDSRGWVAPDPRPVPTA